MMYISYIMKATEHPPRTHAPRAQSSGGLARTQIYLTAEQQARLTQASRGSAATKSALIRQAIDQFLDRQGPSSTSGDKTQRLQELAGLWADDERKADPAAYVRQIRQPRHL